MKGLAGKVALVSGGASGIGAAAVRGFDACGCASVIADIDEIAGGTLAEELGERVLFHRTDVTNDSQIAACVDAATSALGGIDFLVNCAASPSDWSPCRPGTFQLTRGLAAKTALIRS